MYSTSRFWQNSNYNCLNTFLHLIQYSHDYSNSSGSENQYDSAELDIVGRLSDDIAEFLYDYRR